MPHSCACPADEHYHGACKHPRCSRDPNARSRGCTQRTANSRTADQRGAGHSKSTGAVSYPTSGTKYEDVG
ncbi:hypothetical protein [Natrialba sp. INN-245]|uniref:hypothetical protein n=1 Tax=Natrialba sp. INN-245 TaxID=2690967 RepID=UPI0031B6909A